MAFFLTMFCVSGIVLNHRTVFGKVNVSRGWLPRQFQYHNWNNGLLRGTLPMSDGSVMIYGSGGIWLTDSIGKTVCDGSQGMAESADARNIRAVVVMPDGTHIAVAPYDVWKAMPSNTKTTTRGHHRLMSWSRMDIGNGTEEPVRFTDATTRGDTLVILSRSHVYMALPPYRDFKRYELRAPQGYDGSVSLFRTVWMLHSGELFGMPGKIFMDIMALLIMFFCLTGIIIWIMPKYLKRKNKQAKADTSKQPTPATNPSTQPTINPSSEPTTKPYSLFHHPYSNKATKPYSLFHHPYSIHRISLKWHELLGRKTIILTIFVCLTGWMLRPPVLIALVKNSTKPVPFSQLDTPNAWADKLRMIRWDDQQHDWLLSTSSGFYALKDFNTVPAAIEGAPPVSVMGLNVCQRQGKVWLIGSFSGLFLWDRSTANAIDAFTGEPAPTTAGAPFGNVAVAGYTDDIQGRQILSTWYDGVMSLDMQHIGEDGDNSMPQPQSMQALPMSLWSLALEVHTGRIYTFMCGAETLIYVFVAGILALWILWSGWKIRKRTAKKEIR